MEYYLFTTNECNLNCAYCSVMIDVKKQGIPLQPQYAITDLNRFIESMQAKYTDNAIDIIFFGGEPTLNYQFIEDVISQQKEKFSTYELRYMLHTNGLLLSDIPDIILSEISAIMLSINGLEMPAGTARNDYLSKVLKSIHSIKTRSNVPIIGRFTITPQTSLFTQVMSMHSFFDYVYWQIENCNAFDNPSLFLQTYVKDMRHLIRIWEYYLNHGIVLKFIPFLMCIFFRDEAHICKNFLCGYEDSMVYIQTDGLCYSCAEDFLSKKNIIGHILDSIEFSGYCLADTGCSSCEYISLCHGRCGRMHREFSDEHIHEYCKMNKVMFSYFSNNHSRIQKICQKHNIEFEQISYLTNYTEYVP